MAIERKVLLMILDGWGDGDASRADAIASAPTPNMDALRASYPTAQLLTCGEDVGLPQGQMGNSEVGHLNIGAGRVVYQDLVRINRDIAQGVLAKNPVLHAAFAYAKHQRKAVHLMGLVSDGGVHSLDGHLHHLCELATQAGLEQVFVHAFTDGRDTDPKSGLGFLQALLQRVEGTHAKLASIVGRYYAMDRDKRWERIQVAYDLLVHAQGAPASHPLDAVRASYAEGITDEFVKPILCLDAHGNPLPRIKAGDVVICFNFRTDRLRELTQVLTQRNMPEFGMRTLPLRYITMTRYDESFQHVDVLYDKENLHHTLGEVVSQAGCTQLRIAETEKYAHVTFFFSGGREEAFPGERRLLIASPRVATYDLQPQMSALEVTEALLQDMKTQSPDFVCLNFANGDMVGHTGVYEAIQRAVGTVDACVGRIVPAAQAAGYDVLIIADHGNADYAINPDGSPNTAHSLNPVPIIAVTERFRNISSGRLADVAPTVLQLMGLRQPGEMDGRPLCS